MPGGGGNVKQWMKNRKQTRKFNLSWKLVSSSDETLYLRVVKLTLHITGVSFSKYVQ